MTDHPSERIVAKFRVAIRSSDDVTAHQVTIGAEEWVDIHVGEVHLVQLPRGEFLEALYVAATSDPSQDEPEAVH